MITDDFPLGRHGSHASIVNGQDTSGSHGVPPPTTDHDSPSIPDDTAIALAASWCGDLLAPGTLAADPPGLETHADRDGYVLVLPASGTAPLPEGDAPPFVPAGMRERKALVALLRAGWDGVTHLRDMPWVAVGDVLAAHGAHSAAAARHPKGGLATLEHLRMVELDRDPNGTVRRARAGVALWALHEGDDLALRRLAEAVGIGGEAAGAVTEGAS